MTRKVKFLIPLFCLILFPVFAQISPYAYWTLLPAHQMDLIIGESSGETAWNTIMETGGYNKNRQHAEYEGTFYESQYIYDQLCLYGLQGASIDRYPGGEVWDGIEGELWEISPGLEKLASYRDMTAMLVPGSTNADVDAELVWVGQGTQAEIDAAQVEGKIVVTEGSVSRVHGAACQQKGALGVVAISQSRLLFDPIQIPWTSLGGWRSRGEDLKFGFYLPAREGQYLKERLLRGEKIKVHATVKSTKEKYDLQDVTCLIPGSDPKAGEIIFSAHLFEGITKQGANDNKSGSAAILEVARVLHSLIESGRLPRPKHSIRFLWGPEFSGTGPWVQAHKEIMENTLCNINMDMVGEWLSLNKAFMCLERTTYGHPHYINDVMENYYRYVGETSREHIHTRGGYSPTPRRIVAPTGSEDPFYYRIEVHYGASDHEVFNDWGVGVPGVMMIAWPDQWYHTSGDRVDKSDPTQLKRVVTIGAAAAYTIANANDDMVLKIATEISGNGARRLGIQLGLAQETIDESTAETFQQNYKKAVNLINQAADNERRTLATVLELASDKKRVGAYVSSLQAAVSQLRESHLQVLETRMKYTAKQLGTAPARIVLSDLEKKADTLIPAPTAKVKAGGYRAYRELLRDVPQEVRKKYPYGFRDIANTGELNILIDGSRSILDIKDALDAQSPRGSDLQSMINYIRVLEAAGLVTFKK